MDQFSVSTEVAPKATPLLKSANEIAKIILNDHLTKQELSEYCKIAEKDFKELKKKVQTLNFTINENNRTKEEYKNRNKINIINSESLLQALNELNKYKCELKSIYLTTEKALKAKTLKYRNIIDAYNSAWKNTLDDYKRSPVFLELLKFQQENIVLEKEVKKQEKIRACTEAQLTQLKDSIEKKFLEKIVEFSKVVTQYEEFLNSSKRNKENELKNINENFVLKIFKPDGPSLAEKPSMTLDNNDEANISCSIDISVFDEMTVPVENLESQISDEDVIIRQDGDHVSDHSKEQEEDLEFSSNYRQSADPKDAVNNPKENSVRDSLKSTRRTENESQYFKQKPLEVLEQTQSENPQGMERQNLLEDNFYKQKATNEERFESVGVKGKLKSSSGNGLPTALHQVESEDDISRDVQMECEESLSEESYEKQFVNQREKYDRQYQKTSSPSSNELASPGQNLDESTETQKTLKNEQEPGFKPEKNDFKAFTGFFTMGNESEPPTPSIFKLF